MSAWNASCLCSLYFLEFQISLLLFKNKHFQFLIEICYRFTSSFLCWRQILRRVYVSTFIPYRLRILKFRFDLNRRPICLLQPLRNIFLDRAVPWFGPLIILIFQNLVLCIQLILDLFILIVQFNILLWQLLKLSFHTRVLLKHLLLQLFELLDLCLVWFITFHKHVVVFLHVLKDRFDFRQFCVEVG